MIPEAVIDTNVFIAGLRSRRGASFRLLQLVGTRVFRPVVSVALCLEYEDAGVRALTPVGLTHADICEAIDFIGANGRLQAVHYLLRPTLSDADDERILELAFAAGNIPVVTFNSKDFRGSSAYGVRVVTPAEYLVELGAWP